MRDLNNLRDIAAVVQHAALKAVDPAAAVRKFVARHNGEIEVGDRAYRLSDFEHIYLVGAGKAAMPMAEALSELLGDQLSAGVVITKYHHADRPLPDRIRVHEAGHPVPDQQSAAATRDLVQLLHKATPRDLIFCLISGGGSALMTLPAEDITLADLQTTTQLLLRAGAAIQQINTIRKHLDLIKGGGLARAAAAYAANHAPIVSLILSDVIGDDLSVIASGPTVPDPSTFAEAWQIVQQFNLADQLPAAISARLRRGASGELSDTPKPGDPLFDAVQTLIIGSNAQAAQAAEEAARAAGFNTLLLTTQVQGEAREVAKVAVSIAHEIARYNRPVSKPACVILGGETTVTLKGHGLGGRNQEIALAAAIALEGWPNTLIAALGTDGTDGPTDAAGAIATGETVGRAQAIGLDAQAHLTDNDAYHFFQPLGDLIRTGPTGTNVNDLLFILVA